jgi:DNA-binding NtrC family response regulator
MQGSRVLIVDDEKVIADSLAAIFEKQGFQARAAYSAEEALEIIAQWPPRLAILDVVLPGMNGIDLALLIKSGYPDIAVMLISGQLATTELAESAAQLGHKLTIHAKPIPIPDLLANVSQLLATP